MPVTSFAGGEDNPSQTCANGPENALWNTLLNSSKKVPESLVKTSQKTLALFCFKKQNNNTEN